MHRVFIIRKGLHLKPGKPAAVVGCCAEVYWMNMLHAAQAADLAGSAAGQVNEIQRL